MSHINQSGIAPSDDAYAYGRRYGEHLEWPIREDTVLGNALFHVNSHSLNRLTGSLFTFDDKPVLVDHVMFSRYEVIAFATRSTTRYITALYSGLYLNCLDTAFTILGSRGALAELGDDSAEQATSQNQVVGTASQRFASPKDYFDHLVNHMPRCSTRRDAAHVLAAIMLSFIFHHEEGHIFLGHADYAHTVRRAERLAETTSLDKDAQRARSLHHLSEIDADKWAFFQMLTPVSVKSLSMNYPSLGLTQRQWIWLSWLGVALTGAILALLDPQDVADPISWANHPHGILRARETMLSSRANKLAESFPDIDYLNAFVDAWESLSKLSELWPQYKVFQYAFELNGRVEQSIIAFNASITDSHKLDYQNLRTRFEIRRTPKAR